MIKIVFKLKIVDFRLISEVITKAVYSARINPCKGALLNT